MLYPGRQLFSCSCVRCDPSVAAAEYPGLSHSGVVIYGNHGFDDADLQGPILSFNVRLRDGSWVSPAEVRLASIS